MGDVCDLGHLKEQRTHGFDYDFLFIHKDSIKPFAARYKHRDDSKRRWYKVKDNLPPPVEDHRGKLTYVLGNKDIDKNTHIRFYYADDNTEEYIEIPEPNNPFVCNTMQSMNLKKKLFYYTETLCRDPDSTHTQCSVQGGKNKHKSYHKRQQRRSKRRQQKSKRIQRK